MAYSLTTNKIVAPEGNSAVVTLTTSGLPNGTLVPFTISGVGITTADFSGLGGLGGNFNIQNNVGSVTLNYANDIKTEGNETFFLTLNGRTESIGLIIQDTSINSANTPVEFYITTSTSSVNEGAAVTFYIRALYLQNEAVVPYRLAGIADEDMVGGALRGNLTFLSTGNANETSANVTLTILEDFKTESYETIVFLLQPTFPYVLQLTSTVTIKDTSVDINPRYTITADTYRVIEGGNVTFTVTAINVPDGSEIQYNLIPYSVGLTTSDFVNLNSFTGKFPPTTSNTASITFTTRDDYIFEQSEYFGLGIYNQITGQLAAVSSYVEIVDSGNTLLTSAETYTGNVIVSFLESAEIRANVGGIATGKGYWENSDGRISDSTVVQGRTPYAPDDALVYYQPFSYVIRSGRSIDDWKGAIKQVLHPAGLAVFSEINNETRQDSVINAEVKVSTESEIYTYTTITVDRALTTLDASRTTTVNGANLTADAVSLTLNFF